MREQELKRLLLLTCSFMLVSSLFFAATGQQQLAQDFGEANATCLKATSYSTNDMPETRIITEHSSLANSGNETLAGRTRMLDVLENLPVNMKLLFSEAPIFNCESRLSLIIEPQIDAANTEVRIILPEGFSLSTGSLKWTGDLQKNQILQMNVSIIATMIGNWCIEASAFSRPAYGLSKVHSTQCYVQVTEAEAQVFDVAPEDFTKTNAVKLDGSGNSKYEGKSAGNVTVYGTWYYEDQKGRLKPVRYAMVQLWADAAPSDVYLATTHVQSDGHYEFPPIPNNNGSLADGYDIYVKLLCDSYQYNIVKVMLSSNDPRKPPSTPWAQTSTHYNVTDGYYDMGRCVVAGVNSECWAVFDTVVDGYFWLLNQTGWHVPKVWAKARDIVGGEVTIPVMGWSFTWVTAGIETQFCTNTLIAYTMRLEEAVFLH